MRATQKGLQKCQKHQTYLLEGQNCAGMSQKGLQINRMRQTRAQAHRWYTSTCRALREQPRNTCKHISKPELTCQRHKTARGEARNRQNGCAGHAHTQRDAGSLSIPANTLESPGLTYQWHRTRSQKGSIFSSKN